ASIVLSGFSADLGTMDFVGDVEPILKSRCQSCHGPRIQLKEFGDPEIVTRIAQYELAYSMQTAVPELTDISSEPTSVRQLYGPDVKKPGTFAANCLLARRLAERGVRFVQLYHRGWDHHAKLPELLGRQCRDTDQPAAALVRDLKQRGLLDDTLVVWV